MIFVSLPDEAFQKTHIFWKCQVFECQRNRVNSWRRAFSNVLTLSKWRRRQGDKRRRWHWQWWPAIVYILLLDVANILTRGKLEWSLRFFFRITPFTDTWVPADEFLFGCFSGQEFVNLLVFVYDAVDLVEGIGFGGITDSSSWLVVQNGSLNRSRMKMTHVWDMRE